MEVTVELRELDSYDRRGVDGYDLTLEIKPYCHQPASTGIYSLVAYSTYKLPDISSITDV